MPWFFVSVWRLVSRFLEKATLEKVLVNYLMLKINTHVPQLFIGNMHHIFCNGMILVTHGPRANYLAA